MKNRIVIQILFLIVVTFNGFAMESGLPTDTILKRAMNAAEKYNDLVDNYTAEVYMRTYVETIKKNFLYKYTHHIPKFVLHDPGNDEAVKHSVISVSIIPMVTCRTFVR